MALSRGMTALRAALGAVGGGLEGYTQMRALEQKRQQEQEAMRRQSMMDTLSLVQAGAMPTAQRRAVAQEGTSAIGSAITSAMNVAGGGPAIPFDAGAIQRGAGRLGAPAAQITLGETSYDIPSFEEQAQARQARELAQYEAQQGVIEKRESAKEERANRGYFDVLQKAGEIPPNATFDAYRNAPLKPTFDEYLKRTALQEALKRTNIMAGAQASRGGYIQGVDPATGQPQYYFAPSGGGVPQPTGVQAPGKESSLSEMKSGLQAMGVARANSALNLLETNAKAMDKFEADLLANKSSINFVQLELARKALKGDAGSAAAEAALAKSGDSGRALLRYVRGGKAIAGAVREITPRGGSNLMMQMETALSGIGPAGADPESVDQVQVFRNDLLTGVREGVSSMRGTQKPQGPAPEAPSAKPQAVDQDYEAAKQAIAQGRDRAAVIARYEQGTGKKWPGGR